jgi:hypothetical protein
MESDIVEKSKKGKDNTNTHTKRGSHWYAFWPSVFHIG